jgi:hypothetical protein
MRQFQIVLAAAVILALAGCASQPPRMSARFMQRNPVRVAIIPSANKTEEAAAPIMLDKIWEETLTKWGFAIVNADRVVTYAASTGVTLTDINSVPLAVLGRDLSVDYVMFNTITTWKTHYNVLRSSTVVTCVSSIYETKTGALVWTSTWWADNSSGSSNNALADIAVALVHAAVSSMSNAEAKVAAKGANNVTFSSMPYPGFAPVTASHKR